MKVDENTSSRSALNNTFYAVKLFPCGLFKITPNITVSINAEAYC